MLEHLKIWLRVSRANFLASSVLPFCLGSALAGRSGFFSVPLFLAGLAAVLSAHLAANLFNEYWDYRFAADCGDLEYVPHFGGSKAIQGGMIGAGAVRTGAWICLLAALGLGLGLGLWLKRPLVPALVAGGAFIAWAYTAPPLRLAYRGWGEFSLLVAFGPLLVWGGFYLQRGEISGVAGLLSLTPGFLICTLLIGNEFGDADTDERAGKRNLVVRMGRARGLAAYRLCLIAAYLPPLAAPILGGENLFLLAPVFSLPLALGAARRLSRAVREGGAFIASSACTSRLYLIFHGLLILGAVLH